MDIKNITIGIILAVSVLSLIRLLIAWIIVTIEEIKSDQKILRKYPNIGKYIIGEKNEKRARMFMKK